MCGIVEIERIFILLYATTDRMRDVSEPTDAPQKEKNSLIW